MAAHGVGGFVMRFMSHMGWVFGKISGRAGGVF
jgi:hypothetical protein